MKLTRNLFIPCLDTSEKKDGSGFVPIDKSTVFELSFNPGEETYSYICDQNDTTEITSYAPELPQEIVLDSDNPLFAFVYPLLMGLPVGSAAVVPCLLIEPDMATGQPTKGRLWSEAVVSGDTLSTVDGKVSFKLKLNGDPKTGTVAITNESGKKKITFTAAAAAAAAKA